MQWFSLKALFAIVFLVPFMAMAQNQSPLPAANQQLLKSEELDALVAPIALYPDTLLAQVLMASTYPLEVVQADRWVNESKKLKGDELKAAVDKQKWDDSVKALMATPSVISMMSSKLDWTQKLGDAVLAQQADVMDAIQRLRAKAQANNKLSSTKEQKVTVTREQNKQYIAIEPTNPETVYVPYYDPSVVYGGWPYPAYPPYYFGYPGYVPGAVLATGIAFGAGYALGRWGSGGNFWGGSFNWNNNNININRPRVNPLGGNNWQHNPAHRQGVRYNNPRVQQRFGNNSLRSGSQGRIDFRGRGGEQVLRPSGGSSNLGDRGRGSPRVATRTARGSSGAASRPSRGAIGAGRGNAFGNIQSGRMAGLQSQRGRASFSGGGFRGGGGGGFRGGGGGGFRGGGGRRSDFRVKHDVRLLGRLDNGLGFYRFAYDGSDKAYVGVIAQEVQTVEPQAVVVGRDGYLRVLYGRLGFKMQTYDRWIASGARLPSATQIRR
jgi:Protein of unknown function (DUF3300)/Chaperone of endosialidase